MGTCIKLVLTSPMWFHCFSYRVCEFSSHFFVCSRIYVRCILESFYSCRFMSVVSHFRYFQPYTRCNKFSGETLNINLLLCPFFPFIWLWFVNIRHGCWQCHEWHAEPFGKNLHTQKKPNIVRFFTRVCMLYKQMVSHISMSSRSWCVAELSDGCDMHFSI